MRVAYAYVCPLGSPQVLGPQDREEQERAIEAYRRGHLAGFTWGGVYVDPPQAGRQPLTDRTAGAVLQQRLRKGDHVILPALDRAFRSVRDAATTLRRWWKGGVVIHLVDIQTVIEGDNGGGLVRLITRLADSERTGRAERARPGLARRRAAGKAANQYAGYGFKLAGRRGSRRRVPDPVEREVMAAIVRWREAGSDWDQIYWHLFRHNVRTKHGRPWTRSRIRRAYEAELALRAQEGEGQPGQPSNSG